MRFQRAQIWLFVFLSIALLVSSIGVVTDLVSPSSPDASQEQSVEGQPIKKVADVRGVEDAPPAMERSGEPVWPKAGSAEVTLGESLTKVPDVPLAVGKVPGTGSPGKVRVETLGADTAKRLGGVATGVRVTRANGVTGTGRVRVSVDYAGFANAHPGGYAARLGLVQMPACVLAARPDSACAKAAERARMIPVRNDLAGRRLVADVEAAPGASQTDGNVYVVASAAAADNPDSSTGNFAATDLKAAGSWQVGLSGGGFSYSYPIPVPPPVAGEAPSLALSYSSSAIDGLTNYTNNQASVAGMGWEVSSGFIERRFRNCSDDVAETNKNTDQRNWKHLCWESPDENDGDAATTDYTTSHLVLSLDGKSSPIVKDKTSGGWKTVEDFGWRIELLTSSQTSQSFWVVTTTDGTVYRFGYRRDSMWQTAHVGDDPGEPCRAQYSTSGTPGLCNAPWRWNMDQEIDPNGNVVDYTFAREENWYCKVVGALCQPGPLGDGRAFRVPYDRGGYLSQVAYGRNTRVTGSAHTARVTFNAVDRGTPPASGVPWDNDTPTDLNCPSGPSDVITACDIPGPAFYITKRLNTVVTSVHNPSTNGWDEVYRLEAGYKWVYTNIVPPLSPTGPVLWLDTLRPVGLAGDGPDIPLPPVDFEAALLDNRADYNSSQGKARLQFPRVISVYNGLGGRTDVSYGQANPCPYPSGYPITGWDANVRDCYLATLGTYYDSSGIPRTTRAVYMKWLVTKAVDKDLVGGSPDVPTWYQYLGTPAWARAFNYMRATTNNGVLCTPPVTGYCKTLTEDWDEFRGYQTVRTIKGEGTSPDDYSVSTTAFYRGMYDDPRANGTTKQTTITDFDGNTYPDRRVLVGRTLQEQTWRATTLTAQGAVTSAAGGQDGQSAQALAIPSGAKVAGAIGVLAGTVAKKLTRQALRCTYPTWSRTQLYGRGSRVTWRDHHWEGKNLNMGIGAEPGVDSSWADLGICADPTPTPTPTGSQPPDPTPTTPPGNGGPALGGYVEVGSTRHEYATQSTGDGPGIYEPLLINATRQVTREAVTTGFRYTDQRTTYDGYGLPTKVNDYGETGKADDNTCTTTTYARNTTKWLLNYPATVERRAGDACTTGILLARAITLYDGATVPSNAPTTGNPTTTRSYASEADASAAHSTYDLYGRAVSVTDTRGKVSTTAYSPAIGYPANGVVSTNPLGHTTTTWTSAAHGKSVAVRNANRGDVAIDYDSLGRTVKLWNPEKPKSGETPAATVAYHITFNGGLGQPSGPARTTTSTLQSGSGSTAQWVSQHTYVDGFGRTREQQSTSPVGGRIVNVTSYEARGFAQVSSRPFFNTANAGSGLVNPTPAGLPQWTKSLYDGAGRKIAEIENAGNDELRRTTTKFFGDRYEVVPSVGGKTVSHIDTKDRVTKVEEWVNEDTHYDTTYAFDPGGQLIQMRDANGNRRSYTYDLQGHRLTTHDPDSGQSQDHYDSAGLLAWTMDAKGQKVSYSYDDLGRKTAQWAGEPNTGTKLTEYVYDTRAIGKVTSSIRYLDGNAYVDEVIGYDTMGRPTGSTLKIPASEGALAGAYTFTTTYDSAGMTSEVGMPAVGGLPAEQIRSTFTELGLAKSLTSDFGGEFTYVKDTTYTSIGRMAGRSYGSKGQVQRDFTWDDATGWLVKLTTTAHADSTSRLVQDDRYSYDAVGQITRILDAQSTIAGSSSGQSECFSYDKLRRLSAAWTTTGTSCSSEADGLGVDPYKQQYSYDAVGNITALTENDETSTYHYPSPGPSAVRPNAVSSITRPDGNVDGYAYDASGQQTERTTAGKTATVHWNELSQVSKVTVAGKDTSMVYDADGERLIRRDPEGKSTLYLGSMEIESSEGVLTAKRYYTTADGAVVAMRIGRSTGVKWLFSGLHGSMQMSIDDVTGEVGRERYLPFGARRGVHDLPFTERGFLGKVQDDNTGLTYLSARYYDAAIGKFISTDPLLDTRRPQWANPYAYAGNNPVGFSDPTGLSHCSNKDADYNACLQDESRRKCTKLYGKSTCQQMWRAAGEVRLIKDFIRDCAPPSAGKINVCGTMRQLLGLTNDQVDEILESKVKRTALYKAVEIFAGDAMACHDGNAASCLSMLQDGIGGPGSRALKYLGSVFKSSAKTLGWIGCSSFIPGTGVLMGDGTRKAIELVQVGEKVVATNPDTGDTSAKFVVGLVTSGGYKDLVRITVDIDGPTGSRLGEVVATSEHPFWVDGASRWFNASDLRVGMRLQTSGGDTLQIVGISVDRQVAQQVYNLTIEDYHTYHVSVGSEVVLVHNSGCLNAAEQATLSRLQKIFPEENLVGVNLPDGDFIGKSGKFDAMGAPQASAHWSRQKGNFLAQIRRHALKSDYAVVDLTGFTKGQIREVMKYISTLPRKVQNRLIVLDDAKIIN
ncbi:polymorphic toxin-type HINT domain-containing protein [Sphaerisporangium sp. TRM90804]|uniref:polymorphic toxin-type HINT domain-containing protein n=1 Tax=Sphaerisporangium sp. TRM90804 TaxID=3031113 RepID=UPI0024477AB5|nr:polymorphic toxin-type HINT domain-containing protein [Sphaerisporangium sp. TRM90804]MDH2429166.1 polymorphic toxin-type HINT domain-containing protein [Sphaerisporangium sp. TRM90804]